MKPDIDRDTAWQLVEAGLMSVDMYVYFFGMPKSKP